MPSWIMLDSYIVRNGRWHRENLLISPTWEGQFGQQEEIQKK